MNAGCSLARVQTHDADSCYDMKEIHRGGKLHVNAYMLTNHHNP